MKKVLALGCLVVMGCGGVLAQGRRPLLANGVQAEQVDQRGVEVLSDTQGVDFQPYVQGLVRKVYAQWVELLPVEARAAVTEKGVTAIRFTIDPDGTIAAMHLEGKAKDEALNRAAWGAITGVGQFPALPKAFHGPDLELRIHFVVGKPA